MLGIGILGILVWAHHMFITGIDNYAKRYFTSSTVVIGIPPGLKIFS
jgi:cytochrome c oxidase subunit 1